MFGSRRKRQDATAATAASALAAERPAPPRSKLGRLLPRFATRGEGGGRRRRGLGCCSSSAVRVSEPPNDEASDCISNKLGERPSPLQSFDEGNIAGSREFGPAEDKQGGLLQEPLLRREDRSGHDDAPQRRVHWECGEGEPEPERPAEASAASTMASMAHPKNSSQLQAPWMNEVLAILNVFQYGCANFYGSNLKRMWPSVDQDNLHVEVASLHSKYMKELMSALAMSALGFFTFPFRLLVGVPFYCYVILNTRHTDIVSRRVRRHLAFLLEMTPLYMGGLLTLWMLAKAYVGELLFSMTKEQTEKYQAALHPMSGRITQGEMFAPFRAFIVVVVLEVIRKQRRDMTYVVNILRHQLFVDEAVRGKKTEVVFGSVTAPKSADQASTTGQVSNSGPILWLLSTMPSEGERKETLLAAHCARIAHQVAELQIGTGTISEIADAEAAMFFRSNMQDMLEQRIDSLQDTEEMMVAMQGTRPQHKEIKLDMDFNQLVQVLCAGYHKHFVEEVSIMRDHHPPWLVLVIAAIYALLPTFIKVAHDVQENLRDPGTASWAYVIGMGCMRLPLSGDDSVPEVPFLVVLTSAACFLTLYSLLRSVHTAAQDLNMAYEAFIILQRIASKHHLLRAHFERYQQKGTPTSANITNRFNARGFGKTACLFGEDLLDMTHHQSDSGPGGDPLCSLSLVGREVRKRVRFKASIMRGADCHVNVGYKHRFDGIMKRRYIVTGQSGSQLPDTPRGLKRRNSLGGGGCALGDGHLHSFVELDIHRQEPLRMWWVMRLYVESGLLKDKIVMELLLMFAVFLLIVLVLWSISWLILVERICTTHVMSIWEFVCLGIAVLRVLKICARLNRVLSSDSKRLTFIQHDIYEEIASSERRRREAMFGASTDEEREEEEEKSEKSSPALPPRITRNWPVSSRDVANNAIVCEEMRTTFHHFMQRRQAPESRGARGTGNSQEAGGVGGLVLPAESHNHATVLGEDFGGVPMADDPHFERRATIQLLKIFVDHLDRDHRPIRLGGFRIDNHFMTRIYLFTFSFASTAVVHLLAKTLVNVLGSPDQSKTGEDHSTKL